MSSNVIVPGEPNPDDDAAAAPTSPEENKAPEKQPELSAPPGHGDDGGGATRRVDSLQTDDNDLVSALTDLSIDPRFGGSATAPSEAPSAGATDSGASNVGANSAEAVLCTPNATEISSLAATGEVDAASMLSLIQAGEDAGESATDGATRLHTPTSDEAVAAELGDGGTDINKTIIDAPGGNKDVIAPVKTPRSQGRPPGTIKWTLSEKKRMEGLVGLVVVQWNQKDLSYDPGNARSQKRVDNIISELTGWNGRYGSNGPAVCVMQEIVGRAGGGGEKALQKITEGMNSRVDFEGHDGERFYRYELSGVVNPMGGRAEQYAVIYNELLVGECEVDSKFRESLRQFAPDGRDDENTLLVGDAEIDLSRAREVFRRITQEGKLNDRFDRRPALFSFPGPRDTPFPKKLHIIAAHSATGGANKSPHQNMAESVFLQEICHQAAAKGEYCVLAGDFNYDEPHNLTHFMWDSDGELYDAEDNRNSSDVNEKQLFEQTREAFLSHYVRACHKLIPTNVYPFLAGEVSFGKHNDDIWLPKQPGEPVHIEGTPALNPNLFQTANGQVTFGVDLGRGYLGKILEVPPRILQQWEKTTREFYKSRDFEGRYQPRLNNGDRGKLNMMLAKVWSDHRPLVVTLKLTNRRQLAPDAKNRSLANDFEQMKLQSDGDPSV